MPVLVETVSLHRPSLSRSTMLRHNRRACSGISDSMRVPIRLSLARGLLCQYSILSMQTSFYNQVYEKKMTSSLEASASIGNLYTASMYMISEILES